MSLPKVGDKGFFRGTTRDDYLGEVMSVDGPFTVTLKNASWVADSGRFHEFLQHGTAENMEIECIALPFWTVNWTCWGLWPHELPQESI